VAVQGWRRILDGSEVSGKVGESTQVTERWIIKVDDPLTNKLELIGAVPVGWGSAHWEFTNCKAQEFTLTPTDKTGILWILSAKFYVPPRDKKLDELGRIKDFWECNGGTTTVPLFRDVTGASIVNAAGDPLESLERERQEESWTLTKYYEDDTWMDDRAAFDGHINSESWAGGAAKTWKCYFKSARKKEVQDVDVNAIASSEPEGQPEGNGDLRDITYVETVWEFRKEPDTWKAKPWDVGFMELVGGKRKTILGDDGKPVKQPVGLNPNGTRQTPGSKPLVINNGQGVDIYPTADFQTQFGSPFIYTDPT